MYFLIWLLSFDLLELILLDPSFFSLLLIVQEVWSQLVHFCLSGMPHRRVALPRSNTVDQSSGIAALHREALIAIFLGLFNVQIEFLLFWWFHNPHMNLFEASNHQLVKVFLVWTFWSAFGVLDVRVELLGTITIFPQCKEFLLVLIHPLFGRIFDPSLSM